MKTDKELAVDLACAYVGVLNAMKDEDIPNQDQIRRFLTDCYKIIQSLPDSGPLEKS